MMHYVDPLPVSTHRQQQAPLHFSMGASATIARQVEEIVRLIARDKENVASGERRWVSDALVELKWIEWLRRSELGLRARMATRRIFSVTRQ